jgi:predicted phage terminase large subunit-like protein
MRPEVEAIRLVIQQGKLPALLEAIKDDKASQELYFPVIKIAQSQLSHLKFMRHCWGRCRPMVVGLHTWYVCHEIDKAFVNFRNGISTFLITLIVFRHGKSEITTRFLPPHFLSEFPDRNSIVTSHSTKKTNEFSRFGRALIRCEKFKQLYPHIEISSENAGIEEWGLQNYEGLSQYYGILSGSAGTGGALIVTDDYFGGREHAESQEMRDKIDEAYSNNIFTRRDDPSINLITVTPWHCDDLVGRLEKRMKNENDTTRYKIIRMPYKEPREETIVSIQSALLEETDEELKSDMSKQLEQYANGAYLFPQKYSNQWYTDMETSLGGPNGYGTASLMRCSPVLKTGKRFKTEKVKILKLEEFTEKTKGLQFCRAYDLASSVKQVNKTDPDYTVGMKMAVRFIPTSIKELNMAEIYVAHVLRGRWEAPARNQKIIDTAVNDGLIKILIETFGQYKDTYNELKTILRGLRLVKGVRCPGDKLIKSECLEAIFDAGNVYLLSGDWNSKLIDEFNEDTGHDDQIDTMVIGYREFSPVKCGFGYNESVVV